MTEGFKKPALPPPPPPPRGKEAEGEAPAPAPKPPRGPCGPTLQLRYQEPSWGGCPADGEGSSGYSLETVKGGAVLGSLGLSGRSWWLVGRAPSCDLSLAHPSVSRHHAVLQHRPPPAAGDGEQAREAEEEGPAPGLYLYDLDSAHGTFLNKAQVPPRTYCRVRVGHVLRFGGSSRLFILQVRERLAPSVEDLSGGCCCCDSLSL